MAEETLRCKGTKTQRNFVEGALGRIWSEINGIKAINVGIGIGIAIGFELANRQRPIAIAIAIAIPIPMPMVVDRSDKMPAVLPLVGSQR